MPVTKFTDPGAAIAEAEYLANETRTPHSLEMADGYIRVIPTRLAAPARILETVRPIIEKQRGARYGRNAVEFYLADSPEKR